MLAGSLKESDVMKAFLVLAIGSIVGGFVVGFIAGMLLGIVVALSGGNLGDVQLGSMIVGGLLGVVVSYLVFRTVVLKMLAPKLAGVMSSDSTQSAV
jgi:uncharacterized membrane protein YjfL (UPF0719 family)